MNLYKQWKKAIFKRNLLWERDIVQFSLSVRNARRYFIAKRRFLNGTADEILLHVFVRIYTKNKRDYDSFDFKYTIAQYKTD